MTAYTTDDTTIAIIGKSLYIIILILALMGIILLL